MDDYPPRKQKYKKIQKIKPFSKVILSLIAAFVWMLATQGRPPSQDVMQGVSYVDTTIQQIFETTIAVQRKRFRKRLIQQKKGYWQHIPYINQPNWVDLQIRLTTRIGFSIQNSQKANIGFTSDGKLFVEVFQPVILGKNWQTEIIDTSENIFGKWDIREYKQMQLKLIEALALAESQNMLAQFKNNPEKISSLSKRLEHRLEMKSNIFSAPWRWIERINHIIENQIKEVKNQLLGDLNIQKERHQMPKMDEKRDSFKSTEKKDFLQKRDHSLPAIKQKRIGYTKQESQLRQKIKNTIKF